MSPLPLTTTPEELKIGTLLVKSEIESSLPLEHTDVVAQLTGPIATVSVTQRFGNPFDHPIELAYLFPLPEDAAVHAFELRVGGRVVTSRVEEREAARRAYEDARDRGMRTSLVEERRANLFSIEIANVQPHETIVANIRYHERLTFDDAEYRFVFPMGITPKYHHDPREAAATDAPVAHHTSPIGTVAIDVSIDAGVRASDPKSPSHAIELSRLDERRMHVRSAGEIIPNKDFVLRFGVAEDDIRTAAWMSQGTLLLTAIPPRLTTHAEPAPREFVFVIDRSGSMSNGPMAQARNALQACIRALSMSDTFAILAFDDRLEWFKTRAVEVSQGTVDEADRWIRTIDARGGTEIVAAMAEALRLAIDKRRQRYIVFLTDGAVSAEQEVLRLVRKHIGDGRLFTFGIGPSVNRALLSGMASQGRGTAEFLQVHEDIEEALIRFQDRVAYPAVQDVHIEWKNAKAWDVYPARISDLYHGQPLELTARVQVNEGAKVIISGRRGAEQWKTEIALPSPVDDPAIERIWAKERVDALLDEIDRETNIATNRAEVIELAIAHHLMTKYTSLVAVDDEKTNGGESQFVRVAVPLPEGLDAHAFFAGALGAAPAAAPMPLAGGALRRSLAMTGAFAAPPPPPAPASEPMILGKKLDMPSVPTDPLRELARTQHVDGSWGSVEKTAAAILEFVRRGHTTKSGHYRRQLARAVKWLRTAQATGAAAKAKEEALEEVARAEA